MRKGMRWKHRTVIPKVVFFMNENFDLNSETFSQENPERTQTFHNPYIPKNFTPETYAEKRNIRKTGHLIGISLLIITAISVFWSTVYFIIMGAFGYSVNKAYEIISEPALMQVLNIVLSSLMFTLPFIAVFKIGKTKIGEFINLKKPEKQTALPLYLLGVSFCSIANILISYASKIFERAGINYEVDFGENPKGFFGFMLSFLATAVVPMLAEEFAFRGVVLGSLRKFGDGFALVSSSILFGIIHGNFQQMPFAFLVGLVLGFTAIKSGSLWIPMAVHFTNNFVSLFFEYVFANSQAEIQNVCYMIYLSFSLLLGIVAFYLLRHKKGDFYKLSKADTACSEKQKYKWFFTTATIIIFTVIMVIESLAYFN